VVRAGSRVTKQGAAATFTGVVFQDPVVVTEAPSRMGGSVVTFTPGARTAWHAHPSGRRSIASRGRPDLFRGRGAAGIEPGRCRQHPAQYPALARASPDRLFAHLALSEAGEKGEGTSWGKHVSDTEYATPATGG